MIVEAYSHPKCSTASPTPVDRSDPTRRAIGTSIAESLARASELSTPPEAGINCY
jgi:hypothetical protein